MQVTLFGIVTCLGMGLPMNAELPIIVTGRPLMVLGIVTTSTVPVKRVMVTVVPSEVHLNRFVCPRTGQDIASTRKHQNTRSHLINGEQLW
jgi:hypothetical protein